LGFKWCKSKLGLFVPQPQTAHRNNEHRFQQVDVASTNLRVDLAFDTCTGRVCKTWEWNAQTSDDPFHAPYRNVPLCATSSNQ
jgi:hypothetical protein